MVGLKRTVSQIRAFTQGYRILLLYLDCSICIPQVFIGHSSGKETETKLRWSVSVIILNGASLLVLGNCMEASRCSLFRPSRYVFVANPFYLDGPTPGWLLLAGARVCLVFHVQHQDCCTCRYMNWVRVSMLSREKCSLK